MTDKWVFIVNPVAGNGSAKSLLPKLEEMIRKNNVDAEIVFTKETDMLLNCQNLS